MAKLSPEKRIAGAVLVGGSSQRFGSPKTNIVVGAERLLERTCRIMKQALGHTPMLVGGDELPDEQPQLGPIGGLETALLRAKNQEYNSVIIVACDMPGITVPLVRWIAQHPSTAYAVVPKVSGKLQPLFARYLTSFHPFVKEAISCNIRSLMDLLKKHPPQLIEEEELARHVESPRQQFANINTPNDLKNFRKAETS